MAPGCCHNFLESSFSVCDDVGFIEFTANLIMFVGFNHYLGDDEVGLSDSIDDLQLGCDYIGFDDFRPSFKTSICGSNAPLSFPGCKPELISLFEKYNLRSSGNYLCGVKFPKPSSLIKPYGWVVKFSPLAYDSVQFKLLQFKLLVHDHVKDIYFSLNYNFKRYRLSRAAVIPVG